MSKRKERKRVKLFCFHAFFSIEKEKKKFLTKKSISNIRKIKPLLRKKKREEIFFSNVLFWGCFFLDVGKDLSDSTLK